MKVPKFNLTTFALVHQELNNIPFKKYSLLSESHNNNLIGLEGSLEVAPILGDYICLNEPNTTFIDINYYFIIYDYLKSTHREQDIEEYFKLIDWNFKDFQLFIDRLQGRGTGSDDLLNGFDVNILCELHSKIIYPYIIKPILIDNRDNIKGDIIIALPAGTPFRGAIWVEADEKIIENYYLAMKTLTPRLPPYIIQSREFAQQLNILTYIGQSKYTLTLDNTKEVVDLIKEKLNG